MPRRRNHKPGYTRSKSGCLTCREKRVKCDEHHPICSRCDRLELTCQWVYPTRPASNSDCTYDAENSGLPPYITPTNDTGSFDLATGVDNGSDGAESSGYSTGITSGDGCSSDGGGGCGEGEGAASSTSTTSGVFPQTLEKLGDYNRHNFNTTKTTDESIRSEPQELPHGSDYTTESSYLELEEFFDNWVVLGENNGDFVQSRGYNSAV